MPDLNSYYNWIFNQLPQGQDLPISCTYQYSFGKSKPDPDDLPELWKIADFPPVEEIIEAGWPEEISSLIEKVYAQGASFIYLRNAEGELVATWDEGRWWTPQESAAFHLMGTAPAAYIMAEQARFEQLPRRIRRRLK